MRHSLVGFSAMSGVAIRGTGPGTQGGAACDTGFPGVCAGGTETCTDGALVCLPDEAAPLCDGLDTNCDGVVDQCTELAFLPSIGESGIDQGETVYPIGVDVDAAGNIYVAAWQGSMVHVFDRNGLLLYEFGGWGAGPGRTTATR